jgi:hypothetical protein
MRRLGFALVLVALVRHASAQPGAPEMSPEARAHLEAGRLRFHEQSYDAAISEFREGYRLQPHPDFLYALAQAQRMNGDCASAVETYRKFLGTGPPQKEAEVAIYNVGRCEAVLGKSPTPAPAPSERPAPARSSSPPVAPPPRAETTASERTPAWYADPLGVALSGGAVVGGAIAAVLWAMGDAQARSANEAQTIGAFEDHAASADHARTVAIVASAVGGGLLIGAIVRFATLPSTARAASPAAARF